METKERFYIYYKVAEIGFAFGTCADEPNIVLKLTSFKFSDGNTSHISAYTTPVCMYLNKSTFNRLTGHWWDGTREGIEKFKEEFEGKKFKFNVADLGM